MRIVSWNVNGIRAAVKKDFEQKIADLGADIYCIQETKAQEDQVEEALSVLSGFEIFSNAAEKKGYSGVSILSSQNPQKVISDIGVKVYDTEGRVITADFGNFYLVNVYVPNSGNGLSRLSYRGKWDKAFARFLKNLRSDKPVIVTGDFNVAHQAIDLARPKQNYNKTAGYTQVEIDGMDRHLKQGFNDAFRYLYPEKVQYTFWSMRFGARAKNIGWRIDYFLVDDLLLPSVKECQIQDQVMGSDHCPIVLDLA
jgi:exodeoxyribonuclease-3